jgi:cytochrome c553
MPEGVERAMAEQWARVIVALVALSTAYPAAGAAPSPAPPAAAKQEQLVQAKTPPFSEGVFPCSQCHDKAGDKTRRTLSFHEDIQGIFDHDAEHRWCLDCHDNANRDLLHLSNGDTLPFTESYRLCGQCHGDKYRDWRAGIHGKRTGRWDGEKTYFLCVNCHNPHSPLFKGVKEIEEAGQKTTSPTLELLKPEPRPRRPEEQRK